MMVSIDWRERLGRFGGDIYGMCRGEKINGEGRGGGGKGEV